MKVRRNLTAFTLTSNSVYSVKTLAYPNSVELIEPMKTIPNRMKSIVPTISRPDNSKWRFLRNEL